MEVLSIIGIIIYVIYSIVQAVGKEAQTKNLSQPKNISPKTISTKNGQKTLEEIIQLALEQKKQKENQSQSQEITIFENTSRELINYEQKSNQIAKIKKNTISIAKNKPKIDTKENTTYIKSSIQKYQNQDAKNDLKFDKDDLKRAFILSEILQKKY